MAEMSAVRYHEFGGPEVLRVETAPCPEPRSGEVLVRVHAASVNGGELLTRAGKLRMVTGKRFPMGSGNDFAGEVAGLGEGVGGYAVGDRVWGLMPHNTFGSMAELVSVPMDKIALAPSGLDLVEAAALPSVATTAIRALRRAARLREGERLLVRGASGGVGSVVVQLGAAMGAQVTALVGARNREWVREIGADEALDYGVTRPGDIGPFDVIVDTVGVGLEAYRRRLARGGRFVALAIDTDHMARSLAYMAGTSVFGGRRARGFSNNPRHDELAELTAEVESGAIRPLVDRVFPLADIVDAHRALAAGGVRGKLVVQVV